MPLKLTPSHYIAITALFISITAASLFLFSASRKSDILVVDKQQLFDKFTMTIEVRKQGDATFNKMKYVLDSLNVRLYASKNPTVTSGLQMQIERQTAALNDFNTHFSVDETENIWKRIDGYIRDYAKENNCALIIGGGTKGGDILYYQPNYDITSKVLAYINTRYEGNK